MVCCDRENYSLSCSQGSGFEIPRALCAHRVFRSAAWEPWTVFHAEVCGAQAAGSRWSRPRQRGAAPRRLAPRAPTGLIILEASAFDHFYSPSLSDSL